MLHIDPDKAPLNLMLLPLKGLQHFRLHLEHNTALHTLRLFWSTLLLRDSCFK
jgi:hypothetical protein